jgi:hypothetical protein
VLRAAQIGWGLERYRPRLDAYCASLEAHVTDAEDDETRERRHARWVLASRAREIVGALLDLVPPPDAPWRRYLAAATTIVRDHVGIRSQTDAFAVAQLTTLLAEAGEAADRPVAPREASNRLVRFAEQAAVEVSGPLPGHLHVTDLAGAGWSGRRHLFVLGLDDARHPGGAHRDPILTDEERSALACGLPSSSDHLRDRAYRLGELLARWRGEATLTYAAYDVSENRRRFPSAALLQAHRLAVGRPDADYEALGAALGEPVGYIADALPLTRSDW